MTATVDRPALRWADRPALPWFVPGHYVDGEVVTTSDADRLDSFNPYDDTPIGGVPVASAAVVADAVHAARAAAADWRSRSGGERGALLREAAHAIRMDSARLAELHTRDSGRLHRDALGAVHAAVGLLEEAAGHGPLDAGRALSGPPGSVDLVRREPRGVVAVLTPWNDPYPAAAGLLAAALVSGNTVVHKPSERCPIAGWAFAELIAEVLPPGVLNVLNGGADTGADLVGHRGVDVVAHVGSSATGELIAHAAGPRAARLLLENGGADALVVDRDVDPVWAAEQAALGAFTNTGQLCVSVERILVHREVAEPFLEALVEQAGQWRAGDPFDDGTRLGPMVDRRAVATVRRHLDDAVRQGAQLLCGGPRADDGCLVDAAVLTGCTDLMATWSDETFGPVAPVRVVDSFEQGLEEAARSQYGLAATVLTRSLANALAAADRLDVGTVKVNHVFGGAPGGSADPRRRSGSGRGYGPDLLAELTALKTVHLEPAP